MIERKVSISFVAWAVAVLLVLTSIPHHHHGDVACVQIELCNRDGNVNDIHTGHHDEEHGRHSEEGECFLSSRIYIVVDHHFSFDQKWSAFSLQNAFDPSVLCLSSPLSFSEKSSLFADYHLYYKSTLLISVNSFRAPPVA